MAARSGYTIRQLLQDQLQNMDEAVAQARHADPDLKSKQLPGMALAIAGNRVAEKLRDALHIDVLEPIARAWANSPELRKAADEADLSSDKTAVVSLGEHDLSAQILPVADVTFAAVGNLKLEFQLTLSVGVSLADVTITERKIVKIGKLEGEASAALSLGPLSLSHPLSHTRIRIHDEFILETPLAIAAEGARQPA